MGKLPEWITKLQNVVRIGIRWSKLKDDPLNALQNLHTLQELHITYDAYYGEKLHFKEGAFPNLKVLILCALSQLRSLVIEEGALSNLEEFDIGPSPQLKELSSGFQHLRHLKKIYICEMPANSLMFQDFQSLQSTGATIWFIQRIDGKLVRFKIQRVMEVLKSIQGK